MTTSDVLDILSGATATNPSGTPYEERTRGVLYHAAPRQVAKMSDRRYVVAPDGSFRRVRVDERGEKRAVVEVNHRAADGQIPGNCSRRGVRPCTWIPNKQPPWWKRWKNARNFPSHVKGRAEGARQHLTISIEQTKRKISTCFHVLQSRC